MVVGGKNHGSRLEVENCFQSAAERNGKQIKEEGETMIKVEVFQCSNPRELKEQVQRFFAAHPDIEVVGLSQSERNSENIYFGISVTLLYRGE